MRSYTGQKSDHKLDHKTYNRGDDVFLFGNEIPDYVCHPLFIYKNRG
jgi:hypothetical protein